MWDGFPYSMLKAGVPAKPSGTIQHVTEFEVEDMKNTKGLVSIWKRESGWKKGGGVDFP